MKTKTIYLTFLFSTIMTYSQNNIKKWLQEMTHEEKVNLVVGMGMNISGIDNTGPTVGQTMDKVPGAAGTTFEIKRLGIPNTVLADGPAGLRILSNRPNDTKTYFATAFPVGTLLASTWNTDLVEKVGKAMGNEVKEYGVDILLAPALNIQRNALGGRNFEYYSEDPVISGNIAAAMVNGIQSNGVGTSIKHYAANNQETNRNLVNVKISERALREIYLKGFEIAVKKSNPWTVMSSYNKINGSYTSQSFNLLTTVLRDEWKYKGYVMTDWFGGNNAIEQLKAGNDLLMPGTENQKKEILEGIKNKTITELDLNKNVEKILTILLQTPSYKKYKYSNNPKLIENAKISRQAATEGMVLLQNNKETLPIKKPNQVAVFGNNAYDLISGGTGSGDVNEAYTISLIDGFKNANIKLDSDLIKKYESYKLEEKAKLPAKKFFFELSPPIPEMEIDVKLIEKNAKENDIAFISIGRNAGEFQDRKEKYDYELTPKELELISKISTEFHKENKKVIVILNIGGVIEIASWKDKADAILLAWQGGQEMGNAVIDLITGKENPSGRLAVTFPLHYQDDISSKNFPGKNTSNEEVKGFGGMSLGHNSEVQYDEDIYVGYRFFTSQKMKTCYDFGFGLSYTQFDYSNFKINKKVFKNELEVMVDVTNIGKITGKEVVQLYLSSPESKTKRPKVELIAFSKTKTLQPNEKQTIKFILNAKDLAYFNDKNFSWTIDSGKYQLKLGKSSTRFIEENNFIVKKNIQVEKVNKLY